MQQPLDLSQEASGDLLLQLEALLASNHVAPKIVSKHQAVAVADRHVLAQGDNDGSASP